MHQNAKLAQVDFDRLRQYDTCTLANAIERFDVRLRNEGFIHGTAACQFPQLPPMLGYAVTGRIRSSVPPVQGGWYYDRMEWWEHVLSVPAPRVIVIEDVDPAPGLGAFFGEVHANIGRALDCVGYVTNGAVRDLAAVEAAGFHLFAGGVAVSHAYAHIVEFGEPVEIGGLAIRPGDLLHGDRHGVQSVPLSIAPQLPEVAEEIRAQERELFRVCQSSEFSVTALSQKIREIAASTPRS